MKLVGCLVVSVLLTQHAYCGLGGDALNSVAANIGNAFGADLMSKLEFGVSGWIENWTKHDMRLKTCENGDHGGVILEPYAETIFAAGNATFKADNPEATGVGHSCVYALIRQEFVPAIDEQISSNVKFSDIQLGFDVSSVSASTVSAKVCAYGLSRDCKQGSKSKFQPMRFCHPGQDICIEGVIGSGALTSVSYSIYPCLYENLKDETGVKFTKQQFREFIGLFREGKQCGAKKKKKAAAAKSE